MKIFTIMLGLLNGLYMINDGIFVMLIGKYIGPEKPGPWSYVFNKMQINVFKLGPMFILYGILWLVYVMAFGFNYSWSYTLGIVLSIATLWYLPFGTIISLITLIILLYRKFTV